MRRRPARGDLRADLPRELRRPGLPADRRGAANEGFAAADRHFPPSKLFSEMLMVESDHDMRNSADFISLDRVAKEPHSRFPASPWCRASPDPWAGHSTTPTCPTCSPPRAAQRSTAAVQPAQNDNTDKQAQIQARHRGDAGQDDRPHPEVGRRSAHHGAHRWRTCRRSPTRSTTTSRISTTSSGRSRTTSTWEPHCYDIPVCYAFRSLFDGLDGIDALDEQIHNAVTDLPGRRRADAADGRPVEDQARRDAGAAGRHRQLLRPGASAVHPDRPDLRRSDQRGQRLRQVPQRRLLLHAPRRRSTTRTSRPVCS